MDEYERLKKLADLGIRTANEVGKLNDPEWKDFDLSDAKTRALFFAMSMMVMSLAAELKGPSENR